MIKNESRIILGSNKVRHDLLLWLGEEITELCERVESLGSESEIQIFRAKSLKSHNPSPLATPDN